MKTYTEIKCLINILNKMWCDNHDKKWFTYEVIGGRLYIEANPIYLTELFTLLWSKCSRYAFYIGTDDGKAEIEVIQLYDDNEKVE